MPLEEPTWWYAQQPGLPARLLAPLARIYARAAGHRLAQAPRVSLPVPVVCIGNFTAGGTGKTPLAIHVADYLKAQARAPAFLTRGYGGAIKGPHWLKAGIDTARDVGDEPMLLARCAPVMVARDRAAGALAMLHGPERCDAVVMDDGLQNPAVAKSLRIAVVDVRRGVGNGLVIPAGPLRAPLEQQLALTDAIVLNTPPETAGAEASSVGRWLRERFPGPVIEARPAPAGDVAWLAGAQVVAFAGIANPGRFFALLEDLGAHVAERITFADHHAFTEAEARALLARARARGARLVTTEKDHVRLIGGTGARAELGSAATPLPIRLAFAERDAERLTVLLDSVLAAGHRTATPPPLSGPSAS